MSTIGTIMLIFLTVSTKQAPPAYKTICLIWLDVIWQCVAECIQRLPQGLLVVPCGVVTLTVSINGPMLRPPRRCDVVRHRALGGLPCLVVLRFDATATTSMRRGEASGAEGAASFKWCSDAILCCLRSRAAYYYTVLAIYGLFITITTRTIAVFDRKFFRCHLPWLTCVVHNSLSV